MKRRLPIFVLVAISLAFMPAGAGPRAQACHQRLLVLSAFPAEIGPALAAIDRANLFTRRLGVRFFRQRRTNIVREIVRVGDGDDSRRGGAHARVIVAQRGVKHRRAIGNR